MFKQSSHTLPERKKAPSKLIAGFAALAATAVITASGFAAAATTAKPSQQDCQKAGFTNYSQCAKEWEHHKNHPGNGYGNNVSVTNNIGVSLENSNGNIVNVVNNIFVNIFN